MTIGQISLTELLAGIVEFDDWFHTDRLPYEWSDLVLDSRKIKAGDIFVALYGDITDGREYINQAIDSGAVAVFAEAGQPWSNHGFIKNVPIIVIGELRKNLGKIAARFYSSPSRSMSVLGVTGTNGKTSCVQLYQQLLSLLSVPSGSIGTLGIVTQKMVTQKGLSESSVIQTVNTTPDAITLQSQLNRWYKQNIKYAAIEVSSHGLQQYRVSEIYFAAAIFTNLSRDHLDYHSSMESYGAAKQKLFDDHNIQVAVLNADDEYVVSLARRLVKTNSIPVLTYSVQDDINSGADVMAKDCEWSQHGVTFTLKSPYGEEQFNSPLFGEFNLSNLIAVLSVLLHQGFSICKLSHAVRQLQPISGRMQQVDVTADVDVIIDYAHTPEALASAIAAIRKHAVKTLIVIFGCGGDRDRGKRPLMGEVAEQLADKVIVTSDNPRFESPEAIAKDIIAGMSCQPDVVLDREAAINKAIKIAEAGAIILLAGKGHEMTQQVGAEHKPFSDYEVAKRALVNRVAA